MWPRHKNYAIVSSAIILLFQAVEARSTAPGPYRLVLNRIHTAAFAFSIAFGLFAAFQVLAAIGKLGSGNKLLPTGKRGENYATGLLYPFLLFFAALSLLTYCILSAITIVYTFNEAKAFNKPLSLPFLAGRSLVLQLIQWFIAFAMLNLIFQRQKLGMDQASMRPYVYKLVLDALLLSGLLGIIIGYTFMDAVYQTLDTDQKWDAVRLSHAYVAFYVAVTLDVIISAFWTWCKLRKESLPDLIMIGQVVKYISPLLVLQIVYEITQHAIQFSSLLYTGNRTSDALFLSRIVVVTTTNFAILWFAL